MKVFDLHRLDVRRIDDWMKSTEIPRLLQGRRVQLFC